MSPSNPGLRLSSHRPPSSPPHTVLAPSGPVVRLVQSHPGTVSYLAVSGLPFAEPPSPLTPPPSPGNPGLTPLSASPRVLRFPRRSRRGWERNGNAKVVDVLLGAMHCEASML